MNYKALGLAFASITGLLIAIGIWFFISYYWPTYAVIMIFLYTLIALYKVFDEFDKARKGKS